MSKGKQKKLIRAIAYLRKSTKGKTTSGKQKQEKSLPQQKKEIEKLIKGEYEIKDDDWYSDPGKSASKAKVVREDYDRILKRAKEEGDFQAIVVDNLDRLNRGPFDSTYGDLIRLKQAGVKFIVTASSGTHPLDDNIGNLLHLVVLICGNHEYSKNLSRRVSLARRNAALEGNRTGGKIPYALKDDGKSGLLHGALKEIKVVRLIFDLYVNQNRSMNYIANLLNQRGVPAPQGGVWYVVTIKGILKKRCYRGDFVFNEDPSDTAFFQIDSKGEGVERSEANGNGKVIVVKGRYKPVVAPALFDRAQKKLDRIGADHTQRKRMGYSLTGVLFCIHCGCPMTGAKPRGTNVYRCTSSGVKGKDSCGNYQIREDVILPFLMKMLGEELADIEQLLTTPPKKLRQPRQHAKERKADLQKRREELTTQLKIAVEKSLTDDAMVRKIADDIIKEKTAELSAVEAELEADAGPVDGYSKQELDALQSWYAAFEESGVSIPVKGHTMKTIFHKSPHCSEDAVLVDPRRLNQCLMELGARVDLSWKTEKREKANRYFLANGRFRLGQREGSLPKHIVEGSACRSFGSLSSRACGPISPGRSRPG